ncbi:import into nucleus [Pyrenophora seminiperda CCB06]|uniref:Import into nucleus n=1 Tax=Pyrenophora seminiperda CCB06 TaxID=1302712 RepID=A0A3M7MH97_9PLEO|nr:import into nucleus [Pyrenophora seminiperda CCB06]
MLAEMQKLKVELATKAKEVDDLRAQLDVAKSTEHTAGDQARQEASQDNEAIAAIKASLDQRETELKALEASLNVRQADLDAREEAVAKRESRSEDLKVKANKKIVEYKKEYEAKIATLQEEHQAEVERLQQENQSAAAANSVAPAQEVPQQTPDASAPVPDASASVPDGMINTEDLPRPTVNDNQLAQWLKHNQGALRVVKSQIQTNLKKAVAGRDETIANLRQELEQITTQKAIDGITAVKQEPEQVKSASSGDDPEVTAAWEEKIQQKVKEKEMSLTKTFEMKSKVKDSQLALVRARFAYVDKAAKETPTEEVAKVYAIAMTQKPEVKNVAPPATPAKQDAAQPGAQDQEPNTSTPSQPGAQPAFAQQQQATPLAANTPQANGANNAFAAQVPQSMPFNQANPFSQSTGFGTPVNPFLQGQNQMGRGVSQPGFAYPGQVPGQQLPQMQQQQQQQQFGRGNGLAQTIRGALQSNIPRGGSNIPMPGGRGRGQQSQQNQPQQQQQVQTQNQPQGQPASQIGRGGGRGAGRGGRGGQQNQNQNNNHNSPRQSLNAAAPGFQPGQGGGQQQGGRGQKRGAEDEGDGSATRGGKRPRGRGGAGGAE